MNINLRPSTTATGKPELIVCPDCDWDAFARYAEAVVNQYGMKTTRKIDGFDERMWLVKLDLAEYCISWDFWMRDVSVMCWGDTPDDALNQLLAEG
jgi:hypothetical protein